MVIPRPSTILPGTWRRAAAGAGVFTVFEIQRRTCPKPHQRETIARVFECRVVDRYGLAEFGVVAYQMDGDSNALRVYDGFVWPETTEEGEIVLTGLTNRMMPLIRYRTGDLATLTGTCREAMYSQIWSDGSTIWFRSTARPMPRTISRTCCSASEASPSSRYCLARDQSCGWFLSQIGIQKASAAGLPAGGAPASGSNSSSQGRLS